MDKPTNKTRDANFDAFLVEAPANFCVDIYNRNPSLRFGDEAVSRLLALAGIAEGISLCIGLYEDVPIDRHFTQAEKLLAEVNDEREELLKCVTPTPAPYKRHCLTCGRPFSVPAITGPRSERNALCCSEKCLDVFGDQESALAADYRNNVMVVKAAGFTRDTVTSKLKQ